MLTSEFAVRFFERLNFYLKFPQTETATTLSGRCHFGLFLIFVIFCNPFVRHRLCSSMDRVFASEAKYGSSNLPKVIYNFTTFNAKRFN